jgi:aspartyl-tRNA synthetase
VKGLVRKRADKDINKDMTSGEIEILASELDVCSESQTLPFSIGEKAARANDALRLQYRYLDLRRPEVARPFVVRSKLTGVIHRFMQEENFLHIETPELCKATPEGARDFLVPSRREAGTFYALPQSPQLFKQLLMVSGFDRYYQMARCFRDEDLRADRAPEFTQLDVETSFTTPEEIFGIIEHLIGEIGKSIPEINLNPELPFPRMTWHEAMHNYGSDKPDTRFGLKIQDLTDVISQGGESGFMAIDTTINDGGVIRAIVVNGGSERYSRKQLDELSKVAQVAGGKGVLYVKWNSDGFAGPLTKTFGEERLTAICSSIGAKAGDLVILAAGKDIPTSEIMGAVRLSLGETEGLIPESGYSFLWVTDFPWLEEDEETGEFKALHHPFTKPRLDDFEKYIKTAPGKIRAQAYDIVLNGYEIGGGSIRIHEASLQSKMFDLLGIDDETANEKFGFLLEALKFGAPPHGGIALGIDRMAAIFTGKSSIKDVIAFPKTGQGKCLMTGAPSEAGNDALDELGLVVVKKD